MAAMLDSLMGILKSFFGGMLLFLGALILYSWATRGLDLAAEVHLTPGMAIPAWTCVPMLAIGSFGFLSDYLFRKR